MQGITLTNKKIIVTGGTGFLGQHLVKALLKEGIPEENIFTPKSEDYDLRVAANINRMFDYFPCDILIHLAAHVGGIGLNLVRPGELFYNNLIMGIELMEISRQRKVEKFVAVGTICAYPKHLAIPFKEEDLWNGYPEETNAPYGLAKKMLLVQSQSYRKQYGFNSIFLLPTNLYGPNDNFNPEASHVVPALIKNSYEAKLAKVSTMAVWGNGTATRDFLFVKDAAEGIVQATKYYNESEPVNLGSGREVSIKDLANQIIQIMGYKCTIQWDATMPSGQPRRKVDITRAKKAFDFSAKVELEKGLEETITWYIAHAR